MTTPPIPQGSFVFAYDPPWGYFSDPKNAQKIQLSPHKKSTNDSQSAPSSSSSSASQSAASTTTEMDTSNTSTSTDAKD